MVLVSIQGFRKPRKQLYLGLSGCLWARALRRVKPACETGSFKISLQGDSSPSLANA